MTFTPPVTRRALLIALSGVSATAALASCAPAADPAAPDAEVDLSEVSDAPRSGTVGLPVQGPATLLDRAQWSTKVATGTSAVITPVGVLVYAGDSSGGTWRVALLDPETGKEKMTTRRINSGAVPRMGWFREDGRVWLAVSVPNDSNSTMVAYVYDGGLGGEVLPTRSKSFDAADKATPALVWGANGGLMVTGSDEGTKAGAAVRYRPVSGAFTAFGKGPKRGKVAASPYAVHNGGWIVTYRGGGFGLATEQAGWDSAALAPEGADTSAGSILGLAGDFLVASWPTREAQEGAAPQSVLAVHDLRTGQVRATASASAADIEAWAKARAAVVISQDSTAAAWGRATFDLTSGKGSILTALPEGMLALSQRGERLYARNPENGDVATVDLTNGSIDTNAAVVPFGFTDVDQGLILDTRSGDTLYSVAPR